MARKKKENLSRRDFIKTAAGAVGAVTIGGALIGPRKIFAAEPVKFGMITPLEGECAQWGHPILRGAQIWSDEQNAKGGILCGDGERHPIEYDGYTNVCFYPNEELKAAKKAILEDKKNYLFQTYTPSCRKAIAEIVTQNKVLVNCYGAGYLSPTHPYLMGGITGIPTSYIPVSAYMIEKNPEIKRIAIVCTDDSFGIAAQWYYAAGCAGSRDKVEVVYNKTFDPKLSDFFNLLGSVLKEKPDALLIGTLPPGKLTLLLETGMTLGYEGFWTHESWDLGHILKRVSPEQIDGKLYAAYGVDASVPGFHPRMDQMYKTYCERYGAEEWLAVSGVTYSACCTFEPGFAAAKSADPATVMKTLYAMPEVDQPIYGKSVWTGKEVFGADHHLLTPVGIYVVRGGQQTYSGKFDLGPWWAKNKDVAVPVLREGGQIFG
jgi:branched-chain amino acid transport system substrate-binding protein